MAVPENTVDTIKLTAAQRRVLTELPEWKPSNKKAYDQLVSHGLVFRVGDSYERKMAGDELLAQLNGDQAVEPPSEATVETPEVWLPKDQRPAETPRQEIDRLVAELQASPQAKPVAAPKPSKALSAQKQALHDVRAGARKALIAAWEEHLRYGGGDVAGYIAKMQEARAICGEAIEMAEAYAVALEAATSATPIAPTPAPVAPPTPAAPSAPVEEEEMTLEDLAAAFENDE